MVLISARLELARVRVIGSRLYSDKRERHSISFQCFFIIFAYSPATKVVQEMFVVVSPALFACQNKHIKEICLDYIVGPSQII